LQKVLDFLIIHLHFVIYVNPKCVRDTICVPNNTTPRPLHIKYGEELGSCHGYFLRSKSGCIAAVSTILFVAPLHLTL